MWRLTGGVPEDAYEVVDAQVHLGRDVGESERLGQTVLHDGCGIADSGVLTVRYTRIPPLRQQVYREERGSRLGVEVTRLPMGRQRLYEVFQHRVTRAQPGRYGLEVRLSPTQLSRCPLVDSARDVHLDGGQGGCRCVAAHGRTTRHHEFQPTGRPASLRRRPFGADLHVGLPGSAEHEMQVGGAGQVQVLDLARVREALHKQRAPVGVVPTAVAAPYVLCHVDIAVGRQIEVGRIEHAGSLAMSDASRRREAAHHQPACRAVAATRRLRPALHLQGRHF
ncbi:hypothetical protein BX257_8588 [Streptomyces sp. 3212.3]|nr:hypothetical protein BX257_8588 [Streptomyces sp. 3212.3]